MMSQPAFEDLGDQVEGASLYYSGANGFATSYTDIDHALEC